MDMTLDYITDGKVTICMEDLPDSFDGSAMTPMAEHLFKVNDKVESLGQGNADIFHSTTE